jgi:hypothetical protein
MRPARTCAPAPGEKLVAARAESAAPEGLCSGDIALTWSKQFARTEIRYAT